MTYPMVYPVISLTGGPYKPSPHEVATFFNQSDAVDFVNASLGERNLYIGPAKYDRRTSGYRASDPYANAYREWLASLDETPLTEVRGDPFLKARAA